MFSDRPGLCDPVIAAHVNGEDEGRGLAKTKEPYQVPPILKQEIERHNRKLLRWYDNQNYCVGMIIVSPKAHPIVCMMESVRQYVCVAIIVISTRFVSRLSATETK